jgi:serine/threonine protein kinase
MKSLGPSARAVWAKCTARATSGSGRQVALKILPAAFSTDPDRVRRFEQEGRAAAAINQPNVVAIYDAGFDGGVF